MIVIRILTGMDEWVVYRRVKIHPFLLRSISENNSIPPNYPCRPVARICGTSSVSIPFLFKVTYHIYDYMIMPKGDKTLWLCHGLCRMDNVQYFLMLVEFGRDPVLLHAGLIRCFLRPCSTEQQTFSAKLDIYVDSFLLKNDKYQYSWAERCAHALYYHWLKQIHNYLSVWHFSLGMTYLKCRYGHVKCEMMLFIIMMEIGKMNGAIQVLEWAIGLNTDMLWWIRSLA